MRLTSSCTETSTRSVPAHVCTTDEFPRKKAQAWQTLPDLPHTDARDPPPPLIRSDTDLNMTFLPEKWVCLMIKLTMDMPEIITALSIEESTLDWTKLGSLDCLSLVVLYAHHPLCTSCSQILKHSPHRFSDHMTVYGLSSPSACAFFNFAAFFNFVQNSGSYDICKVLMFVANCAAKRQAKMGITRTL